MAEYLSKETLQEKLNRKKAGPATKRYTEGWNDAILMVKSMVHSEKAADVAPVQHGRWVKRGCKWQCTQCKVLMSIDGTPKENLLNYCPNCGSKMNLEG